MSSSEQWSPDPSERHELRWWDGSRWSEHVADGGTPGVDHVGAGVTAAPPEGTILLSAEQSPDGNPVVLPAGVVMASRGQRLGAHLLGVLLFLVTLGIGYIVWALIVWERGQTPPKQLMRMRVVHVRQREAASWGQMALRQFVIRLLIDVFLSGLFALIGGLFIFRKDHRTLWDLMADTIVVHDPENAMWPRPSDGSPLQQ